MEKADGKKPLDEVGDFIKGMTFGEVVITIHDTKIVQVEKREKKRLPMSRAAIKNG